MPITPSSAPDVARLVDELASADELRRETAIARLAVIGARAVSRLMGVAADATRPASSRVAALQTLEAIGDPRSLTVAGSSAVEPDDRIGIAAIGVLAKLSRGSSTAATRAFDRLTAMVLDSSASVERRLAALTALTGPATATLPARDERVLAPIYAALAADASSRIRARVARREAGATQSIESLIEADGPGLPDDPLIAIALVRDDGPTARVTVLRHAIDAVRARERDAPAAAREQWSGVRGLLHRQLAGRDSRLAVFDLRESFQSADRPLPAGFVAAAAAIGDSSCLEPIAAAWLRGSDPWWRDHLFEAFRAIVRREGLTRRHPALRKILDKWPSAGALVGTARASRRG
jgi:hypothetical protein